MDACAAYNELIRHTQELATLASIAELLNWDEETYLPRGGVANRGNQNALMAGLCHEKATHPRVGELLDHLEGSPLTAHPESPAAVNIRELRRSYRRLTRLPRPLVEELARTTSLAQQEWVTARQDTDFGIFRPWLEKIVALKRAEAEALGYETVPYDALLEDFEPGLQSNTIAGLFDGLRRELLPLVSTLTHATRQATTSWVLHREFPLDRQRVFCAETAAALGFDFQRGRIDSTTHPFFSAIGPGDCRIATRYRTHDFCEAFFATLHEVGHALYEQGLDPEHAGTPMGEVPSLALHEAQARLWENAVGRRRSFWEHFFPLTQRVFHEALGDVHLDDFLRAIHRVGPTVNRVRADEVTYNLHILVRFDLERALIAGNLQAADVPAAWNEGYRHHLGITPRHDAEGCLQDGHWSAGLFGYFPMYTLGNLMAAQLFARAANEIADLDAAFARGDFAPLLDWLRRKVHRQGGRYASSVLIERATGSPLSHGAFMASLRRQYEGSIGL